MPANAARVDLVTPASTEPMARAFPDHYFRSYDIRGRVTEAFTPELSRSIGRAIGSEARSRAIPRIAVGRDGRLSSPALAEALIAGITASGVDVLDCGLVPTPLLYYVAYQECAGSGVMVTGSHNPPEDNGVKMVLGYETLAEGAVQALKQRILGGDYVAGRGRVELIAPAAGYVDRIIDTIRLMRPLKVAVDCGNGAAAPLIAPLMHGLGCELLPLYCEVDGNFPHHHPDPSQPDNLADLIALVVREGADIGLAFDGDGDRLGVVDSGGNIIWPDRLLMLLARDVLARHPGGEVIFDVKCSAHLPRVIRAAGGIPVQWKTGHSLLKARLAQSEAQIAGELSGHIFIKEEWYGFDDALFAAARLLAIVAGQGQTSAALFAELPDAISTPELRVTIDEGEASALMARLIDHADELGEGARTTIDGLRIDYADGWGLVRASNTTPCLTLRFEAESESALRRIEQRFRGLLERARPGLEIPF